MSPRIRWAILILAIVGLGFAGESTWVHYRLLTDPTYVSPCDISSTFNCSQVYLSRFGSVWGVPVALGGLIWFALVALVAGFAKPNDKSSAAAGYLFIFATVGLAVVGYLAYASFVQLRTGCVLCMGTYACVISIFVLASMTKSPPLASLPARVFADLRAMAGRPAALMACVLFVAGTAMMVTFFPREGVVAAQAADAPPLPEGVVQSFADAWWKQPRVDLGIAPEGAKVIVVKFNDFMCPGCRQAEVWYKPIIDKFAQSHPGQVKYVMKDWPWNRDCNFNATSTIPGHEASCVSAVAARLARDRGKFDEMVTWLWSHQGTPPQAVQDEAKRLLGVSDFPKDYAQKLPDVQRDIADGGVLHISSTPTYFINGVRLPTDQMMVPQYFEMAINLELAKKG